jgi:hypothetical protein
MSFYKTGVGVDGDTQTRRVLALRGSLSGPLLNVLSGGIKARSDAHGRSKPMQAGSNPARQHPVSFFEQAEACALSGGAVRHRRFTKSQLRNCIPAT